MYKAFLFNRKIESVIGFLVFMHGILLVCVLELSSMCVCVSGGKWEFIHTHVCILALNENLKTLFKTLFANRKIKEARPEKSYVVKL